MDRSSIIDQLIDSDNLKVYFHPIVSMRRKKVIGLEAEFEGMVHNVKYTYNELRNHAYKVNKMLDFEYFCYESALKKFKKYCSTNREFRHVVLFLDFEAGLLYRDYTKFGKLFTLAKHLGIHPNRVAIQISEYKSSDILPLRDFTKALRDKDVIIGFDEVGSGSTNLESLTIVEPNIIKINISRVNSIHKDFYRIGLLKSMSSLAKSLGALLCCKNVNTLSDALLSLETGGDLLQGKIFFDREVGETLIKEKLDIIIQNLSNDFKEYMSSKYNSSNNLLSEFNLIASKIAYELSLSKTNEYEKKMRQFLKINNSIECFYILDKGGIKITETIFAKGKRAKNRKSIFKPSHIGSDHSSKDYYYKVIRSNTGIFISEPYVSCASGNLCTTVSTIFMDENADKYILCIDFDSDKTDYLSCFHD